MAWLAALPDLLTAAGMLLVWLRPDLVGADWVARGVTTMLLEFFVVHASGFFAVVMYSDVSRLKRSLALGGLAAIYLAMLAAFAWGLHAWWMVSAFFWLTFGKIQAVWTGPRRREGSREQNAAIVAWAAGTACYLAAVSATALLQWPVLGVTPQVAAAAGFQGTGLWEQQPHTALAAGVLYFGAMALVRVLVRRWLLAGRSTAPAAAG
ncbi:MAG: hypothetical protein ISP90_09280 [Nevskia sp.]|nr:hypothetical protein [Nevskia sp.]